MKWVRIKTRTEPWINSSILELIWRRDKILCRSNKNRDDKDLRKEFNKLRNRTQREIKIAKTNFFKEKIEENKFNPKGLWRQFKSLGYSNKTKSEYKIVLDIDNSPCFEPKSIAQHINNYFLNIPKNLVKLLPPAPKIFEFSSLFFQQYYSQNDLTANSFVLKPVSENFVNTELSRLNPNKSYGTDGIQAKFLK